MARVLLTNKRATWAKQRGHDGVMRGTTLVFPAPVLARYSDKLVDASNQMTEETRKAVLKLFEHPDVVEHFVKRGVAMDISPAAQARILTNKLKRQFEQLFNGRASVWATTMADQTDANSQTSVQRSLKELSGGLTLPTDALITGQLNEFLTGVVAENVSLIKSIPSEYFMKVQGAVLRSITHGRGLADLEPFFADQEGITRRRAHNIALDQTHKTYNGLNAKRQQAVGLKNFEWIHSGGSQYPRPMHVALDGRICSFANPPVIDEDGTRGLPGQLINCHCTQRPVISFAEGTPQT